MVANEFFKSIARTLGRIFAYILLGILAYFIFTYFDSNQVKALTYPQASYIVLSNNKSITDRQVCENVSSCRPYLIKLYNYSYVDYSNIDIKSDTTYYFTFDMNLILSQQISNPSTNIGTQITMFGSGLTDNLNVTCDRNCDRTIEYNGTTQYYLTSVSGYTTITGYMYSIHLSGEIDTTRAFNNLKFWAWDGSTIGGVASSSLIFSEDYTDIADNINHNNNQNTDKIINSMNNQFNNVIQKFNELKQSNADTQQAVYDNTQAVETMDAHITSESEPDVSQLETIGNMRPIDTPVTDIITLPISILNKEIQSLGGTCQPWNINTGSLLGNNTWTFPCLNIGQYFENYSYSGYNLWQLIDLMICLYMGYEIVMLIISAYNNIANLDDPFNDLYQPRHAYSGYQPRHAKE